MEKKILTIGIGIGLIISSCVFYISYTIIINNKGIKKELQVVEVNEEEKIPALSDDILIEVQPDDKEEPVEIVNNNDDEVEENVDNEVDDSEELEIKEDMEEILYEYVFFEIKEGTPSVSIIENLYKSGIIDDTELFTLYLSDTGATKKLRYGKYNLPINGAYEDIVNILLNIGQ